MCEEDVHEKKSKEREKKWKEKKKRKEIKKRKERGKDKHFFIQINTQTDRQTDGRTDRHKSIIHMRYNIEQYSKSNSIK